MDDLGIHFWKPPSGLFMIAEHGEKYSAVLTWKLLVAGPPGPCQYMYLYIYIYVHICGAYLYLFKYIHIYIYIYEYLYIYICIFNLCYIICIIHTLLLSYHVLVVHARKTRFRQVAELPKDRDPEGGQ